MCRPTLQYDGMPLKYLWNVPISPRHAARADQRPSVRTRGPTSLVHTCTASLDRSPARIRGAIGGQFAHALIGLTYACRAAHEAQIVDTIDQDKIDRIAVRVATANLGITIASSIAVVSAGTTDSKGGEALAITIKLPSDALAKVSGTAASSTIFELNKELREAGEDRFAIVRWDTQ